MIEDKALEQHPQLQQVFSKLLERLEHHVTKKTTDLGEKHFSIPVKNYTDADRFAREMQMLRQSPVALGAASLLEEKGAFFTRNYYGAPTITVCDKQGQVHVLANVCSHRGAIVAQEEKKCAKHFKCPFHGWTYDLEGNLIHLPGEQIAIPDYKKEDFALKKYPSIKKAGIIWSLLDQKLNTAQLLQEFDYLDKELEQLGLNDYKWFKEFTYEGNFNWKICVESFLEIYHFRATHHKTLPKLKFHNISLLDFFGNNARTVVPMDCIAEQFAQTSREKWKLFGHVNIMYFIFPSNFLLLFSDHFGLINITPTAIDQTKIAYTTFVPKESTEEEQQKFRFNAMGLEAVTKEDFAISESIQQTLNSGVQEHFSYTRFEHLIEHFHQCIEKKISKNESI